MCPKIYSAYLGQLKKWKKKEEKTFSLKEIF